MINAAVLSTRGDTPRDALKTELAKFLPSYEALLPPGYGPERLITGALLAATTNPEILQCTTLSIATSVGRIAQWGLDIGLTAYLVPFNTKVKVRGEADRWQKVCTPVADYKGYIELMVAAGARKVEAHEIREGDEFEYALGTEAFLRHVPKKREGRIIGAYGVVWLRGGVTQFEYMDLAEIEAIRSKSKSWNQGELPGWYARKTAIRRLTKYVPKIPRLAAMLNDDERDVVDEEAEVTDAAIKLVDAAEQAAAAPPKGGPTPMRGDGYEAKARSERRPITGEAPREVINMAARPMPTRPLPADPYADFRDPPLTPEEQAAADLAMDQRILEEEGGR